MGHAKPLQSKQKNFPARSLSRSSKRFAHSTDTRSMLAIPLVFGHLRLLVAFHRPVDDLDGCIGERLSLDPPRFSRRFCSFSRRAWDSPLKCPSFIQFSTNNPLRGPPPS